MIERSPMKPIHGAMIGCCISLLPTAALSDAVINEIHYDPMDYRSAAGSLREFVEVYNPSSKTEDLSGYFFSSGIQYTFPPETLLPPDSFLVVARDPEHSRWQGVEYAVHGPYDGKLSNDGERVRLNRADGRIVESFRYNDNAPWPAGANGYGPSLERISWDLPADDYHSWRASLMEDGTAGQVNSVSGTPSHPLILRYETSPLYPRATDAVTVRLVFDAPGTIEKVLLQWEKTGVGNLTTASGNAMMERVPDPSGDGLFRAVIPPAPSQALVRFNVLVARTDGKALELPHVAEPKNFMSYFVFDGEFESLLPVLWEFDEDPGRYFERPGVVILPEGGTVPRVFDGVSISRSGDREKIKFLKGEEFRGDRTINLIHAWGQNGSASLLHEYLGNRLFQDIGVLCPRVDWFRTIDRSEESGLPVHSQRLVIQQVNERFLEMNGRSPEGPLFKRVYSWWEPHTNREEGTEAIEELESIFRSADAEEREGILESVLNREAFLSYSVASVLLSNWDGFHNNHWMYRGPESGDQWEIIPWDLDQTWGIPGVEAGFPPAFPVHGGCGLGRTRPPGPFTGPAHTVESFHEEYLNRLRQELDVSFSLDHLFPAIEETEDLLLDDSEAMQAYTGSSREAWMQGVVESCGSLRSHILARREYLLGALDGPASFNISSATFLDCHTILLTFDRYRDCAHPPLVEDFWVDYGFGHPQRFDVRGPDSLLIEFADPFCPDISYTVSCLNLEDWDRSVTSSMPGRASARYTIPPVIVTEIMYNNRGKDAEWIELFNTTDAPIDVSGWYITDDDTYPAVDEGYTILPPGTVLQPKEAVIVNLWNDPSLPYIPPYDRWQMPEGVRAIDALVGSTSTLDDHGDNLALFDSDEGGSLIDGSLTHRFPDISEAGESIERTDLYFFWGNDLSVSGAFVSTTGPFGVPTGLDDFGEPLSPSASPGRVQIADLSGPCPPERVYDIRPNPPDRRVDAIDLLEWISRTRSGESGFGLEDCELLFEFSLDWRTGLVGSR